MLRALDPQPPISIVRFVCISFTSQRMSAAFTPQTPSAHSGSS